MIERVVVGLSVSSIILFLVKISVKPKILGEYKELEERDDTLAVFAYEQTEVRAMDGLKMNGQRKINKLVTLSRY